MPTARDGEHANDWKRSSRVFSTRSGWQVRTREGHPLGPYPTEFDAEVVAALLVAQLQQAGGQQACRRIIYNFRHDDRFRTVTAEEFSRMARPHATGEARSAGERREYG